jgi:hypothetical protein
MNRRTTGQHCNVSKKRQQAAVERRDAAITRAGNAKERAHLNRKRGDELVAARHDEAAERQIHAAAAAEAERRADVRIEGDQLKPDRSIEAKPDD